jgi:hypothetical protein
MLQIVWFSVKLFLKGKLIREPGDFFTKILMGTAICSSIILSFSYIGLPFALGITLSSVITGACMPYFLKDFKMK